MSNIQNQIKQTALLQELENTIESLQDAQETVLDATKDFYRTVKTFSDQVVEGVKTFASNPLVPDPLSTDNSTKVPNTRFVNGRINAALENAFANLENNGKANKADKWTTARAFKLLDYKNNVLASCNVDGSSNVTLQLPQSFRADVDYAAEAGKSIKDSEGNVIVNTYAKANDVNSLISNGTVANANFATESDKANQDSNGNIIAASYQRHVSELATTPALYVSQSGQDTNDGLTANTPVKTLSKAIAKSHQYNGVTNIYLLGGTITQNEHGMQETVVSNFAQIRLIITTDTILSDNYTFLNSHVEIKTNNHLLTCYGDLYFFKSIFYIFNSTQFGNPTYEEIISDPEIEESGTNVSLSSKNTDGTVTAKCLNLNESYFNITDNILFQVYDPAKGDANHDSFRSTKSYTELTGSTLICGYGTYTNGNLVATKRGSIHLSHNSNIKLRATASLFSKQIGLYGASMIAIHGFASTGYFYARENCVLYINGTFVIEKIINQHPFCLIHGSYAFINGGTIVFKNVQTHCFFLLENQAAMNITSTSAIDFSYEGEDKCTCSFAVINLKANSSVWDKGASWYFNDKLLTGSGTPPHPVYLNRASIFSSPLNDSSNNTFDLFLNKCTVTSGSLITG